MLQVSIEQHLLSSHPVEYHYFEMMRKGLIQLAIRLAKIETGIKEIVNLVILEGLE